MFGDAKIERRIFEQEGDKCKRRNGFDTRWSVGRL
jgi:hypothetical protein